MNPDYQLREMADLLRYSTQLSICKSLLYYKKKTQVYYQDDRFHIALNSSHYNRIIIKRLRHYLDKSAFMKRASRFVVIL
ncbi:hypothetical protein T10_1489 [Trichinella papuae]|uniref:Uncharacterized protein n=1 Tax=Trichinella papuae TaxID=268474 RepID=A0A0V1MC33_9BILA|nr:hypothetical protein T10_1489 [Trichinella papuae]